MREKLVELIRQIVIPFWAGQIADHLISNDVVPVVRCKDCERRNKSADLTDTIYCPWLKLQMRKTDFCSYGERREDEN